MNDVADAAAVEHRGEILAALMFVMGLAALDATIVATAIPSIVGDLGGFARFPWIFSIYLLTQAVVVPIYGRLADLYGRKPVLFFGIGVFLVGSILSGAAWSMVSLIVFRGLQGIGAGAISPITMTIVGDLYTVEERGRPQGYLSSVWGVASVLGPVVGGLLSEYATWRWIFFINLPVGIAAVVLLQARLHERVERRRHRIDYTGAAVLTAALALGILVLLEGGIAWAWLSAPSLGLAVAALVLLACFVVVERHAAEPILPPWLFGRRMLVAGNLSMLAMGAVLIGQSSYIPMFAQGVVGVGPVLAGLALCAYTVSWSIASPLTPRLYLRYGFRFATMLGGFFMTAGCLFFVLVIHEDSALWYVALATLITGFGLGFSSVGVIVGVQAVVGWSRRGVVTGTNLFMRSIGSAIGVAIFGSIANTTLTHRFQDPPPALRGKLPASANAATLSFTHTSSSPAVVAYTRDALFVATHWIFWALVAVAVLAYAAQALLPRRAEELVFPE